LSLDLNILVALMPRVKYRALAGAVPMSMLDGNTQTLLGWFGSYFQAYPDSECVSVDALLTYIRLRGNLDQAQLAVTTTIVDQLRLPVDPTVIANTQNQLEELAFAGRAGALLASYNDNADVDITFELQRLATESRKRIDTSTGAKWADGDILDYILADADDAGFKLNSFPQLAQAIKGIHGGHNICVAAPTDKGKTSLLMRICSDFAEQAIVLCPDRPLLYCINEGQAETLTPRMYQSVLQITRAKLESMAKDGTLLPAYLAKVGRRDAIRLVNTHGMNVAQVSRIIDAHNPYMVVTDMTGRTRSNSNGSGGGNDTAQLEDVWNSYRELAAMGDFIHMGTVQVSGEGMDMLYPPLTAMQNSKVGIQTTLDLALMMGAVSNPDAHFLRGISTPKNKLARTGKRSLNEIQAEFIPETNTWKS
jgi:hypothetical protein